MIECSVDSIPLAQEKELRKWLEMAPLQILLRVANARLKAIEVEAIAAAIKASPMNSKLESAAGLLMDARRYVTFLEVFKEFYERPHDQPFQIVRLS